VGVSVIRGASSVGGAALPGGRIKRAVGSTVARSAATVVVPAGGVVLGAGTLLGFTKAASVGAAVAAMVVVGALAGAAAVG
jgi:hypothetical protein